MTGGLFVSHHFISHVGGGKLEGEIRGSGKPPITVACLICLMK